jgi:hypothetical protein
MTRVHLIGLTLAAGIAASVSLGAQQPSRYSVPRTEHGQPDFQGVWATRFVTRLERPTGVDNLVVSAEQMKEVAAAIRSKLPAVQDPDVGIENIEQLAHVNGQYRSSVIVDPPDGKMPLTPFGLELVATLDRRFSQDFDGPEHRPMGERCLESIDYAPMRPLPRSVPHQIVQTRDSVAIMAEDSVGLRVIHLSGDAPPASMRSVEGYSAGHWEGDTLIVDTTHFSAGYPARDGIGRPLVISPNTKIIERFRRVSDRELFYRFTVEDAGLYTQPWSGEFSMTRFDGRLFEYACHEGNYSLSNILRGGQAEAAKKAGK